jgi:hypothetical protein
MQIVEDANQIPADSAADTSVIHLNNLLLLILQQQFIVHTLFTEFVFNHGDAMAVLLGQDTFKQGGLATAQKASQNGHRNMLARLHKQPQGQK